MKPPAGGVAKIEDHILAILELLGAECTDAPELADQNISHDFGFGQRHRACWTPIKAATLYVSVHVAEFPKCGGFGEVLQLPLPYCPQCEGEPADTPRSCVHVSLVVARRER